MRVRKDESYGAAEGKDSGFGGDTQEQRKEGIKKREKDKGRRKEIRKQWTDMCRSGYMCVCMCMCVASSSSSLFFFIFLYYNKSLHILPHSIYRPPLLLSYAPLSGSILSILLPTHPASLLCTCPNHLNLASLTMYSIRPTFALSL